jgi:hypothetical protein
VEFSNVLLLVLGAGAAVINPLFDKVAPLIAAFFRRRAARTHEVPHPCG